MSDQRLYRKKDPRDPSRKLPNWYTTIAGRAVSTGCRDREAAMAKAAKMEREHHQTALGEADPIDAWYRRPASCYVYFLAGPNGAIKIGRAEDPDVRLARLQAGSPVELRLVAAIPGGPQLERALHLMFAAGRKEGEWFTASPRLMAVVRELALVLGRPVVIGKGGERRTRRADERRAAKRAATGIAQAPDASQNAEKGGQS